MQKIVPFLWFDTQAEEAVHYYTSIFKNSKIGSITRYTDVGPGPKGTILTIAFQLNGQEFVALNGGRVFKFNEAISFVVNCENQAEIDGYWEKLSAGGQEIQCGWLKDKYGVCWQIVPTVLFEMLRDPDTNKVNRVMTALQQMIKLDLARLQQAYHTK